MLGMDIVEKRGYSVWYWCLSTLHDVCGHYAAPRDSSRQNRAWQTAPSTHPGSFLQRLGVSWKVVNLIELATPVENQSISVLQVNVTLSYTVSSDIQNAGGEHGAGCLLSQDQALHVSTPALQHPVCGRFALPADLMLTLNLKAPFQIL